MPTVNKVDFPHKSMIKIVYFDEDSASDYLDISAGGQSVATSENVRDRTTKLHGEVETRLAAQGTGASALTRKCEQMIACYMPAWIDSRCITGPQMSG